MCIVLYIADFHYSPGKFVPYLIEASQARVITPWEWPQAKWADQSEDTASILVDAGAVGTRNTDTYFPIVRTCV